MIPREDVERRARELDEQGDNGCAADATMLRDLVAERDGLDALVSRMHAQDVAAIKQYQATHPGTELEWPGQVRLTAWCLGEVARWRDECERLRLGGCARGQTTTQWCAEAVDMMAQRDAARRVSQAFEAETEKAHANSKRWRAERDEWRAKAESEGDIVFSLKAERDAAQAALRTAAGLANEMTWKASTRPFADRLANIIRDGFTARAALKGPTP
jgi:hypothetical protein